jgi:hypothetical protein
MQLTTVCDFDPVMRYEFHCLVREFAVIVSEQRAVKQGHRQSALYRDATIYRLKYPRKVQSGARRLVRIACCPVRCPIAGQ